MGNTQGKIKNSHEESSQHDSKKNSNAFSLCNKKTSISSNENIFSVICYHTYQKCSFKLIEFPENETSRNIDSQLGILNLTFKEFITTKTIFGGILKTFQISEIKLPSNIYVCIISRMWNIFFKFEETFEEEINQIKKNYKNIIDVLEKNLPIENEFEYKFFNSEEYSKNINKNKNENFSPIIEKISHKKIISPNFGKKKNLKFISFTDEEITKFSLIFPHLRVIPNFHQNLLGFFYEKFDYITDKEFLSFYLIGLNKSLSDIDIHNEIEKSKGFKIKEIIRNPYEEQSIARVIYYKENLNSFQNFTRTKIIIKGTPLMILPIPYEERITPEELYKNFQVHLMSRERIVNRNLLVKIIEKNFGAILEINFLTLTHAVITFFERKSVDICLEKNHIVYFEEKEQTEEESVIVENYMDSQCSVLKENVTHTLTFSLDYYSTPIKGEKIYVNSFDDKKRESCFKPLPIRPHTPFMFGNTYIPSVNSLIRASAMWSDFKLENEYSKVFTVEECLSTFISETSNAKSSVIENLTMNSPKTNTNTYHSSVENPRENEEYVIKKKRNFKYESVNNLKKENRHWKRNFKSNNYYGRKNSSCFNGQIRKNNFSYKNKKFSENKNHYEKFTKNKEPENNLNHVEVEKDNSDNLSTFSIGKKDQMNTSNFLDMSELNHIFSQSETSFSKKQNEEKNIIRDDEDFQEIPSRVEIVNITNSHTKNDDMFLDEFDQDFTDSKNIKKKPIKCDKELLNLIPTNFINSNKILDDMVNELKKGNEKPTHKFQSVANKLSFKKEYLHAKKKPLYSKNNFKRENNFSKFKNNEFLNKKRKSCPDPIHISDDSSVQYKKKKYDDINIIILDEEECHSNSVKAPEVDLDRTLSYLDCEKNQDIMIELNDMSDH